MIKTAFLTLTLALVATTSSAAWKEIYTYSAGDSFEDSPFRFEKGFVRNKEMQYYTETADVFEVTPAGLVLRGIAKPVLNVDYDKDSKDWRKSRMRAAYQSASLISKQPYRHFAIEVQASVVDGTGAWPAIWLRGQNKDRYGEIDLMEQVGYRPEKIYSSIHLGTSGDNRTSLSSSRIIKGFLGRMVTYRAIVTPEYVRVVVDGKTMIESSRTVDYKGAKPLDQPFHPVINMALGGSWGGKIDDGKLPATMTVRRIKLWEWIPDASSPPASTPE